MFEFVNLYMVSFSVFLPAACPDFCQIGHFKISILIQINRLLRLSRKRTLSCSDKCVLKFV